MPYECELCVFRKLKSRDPTQSNPKDILLRACIKRAILDSFWSRATGTVEGYSRKAARMVEFSQMVGLGGPFVHTKQLPWEDHCGYEVAVEILLYSRKEGRNSRFLQFDTIRSFRTVFGNFVRSSPQGTEVSWALGDDQGRYQRLSSDACSSLWFARFMEGLKNRMGQVWLPNRALSNDLRDEFFRRIEEKVTAAEHDPTQHRRWIVFQLYASLVYVLSLRGPEGFLLDLDGLNRHWDELRNEYVTIALLGRVKGESHDRAHLLPSAVETKSGVKVKSIVGRFLEAKGNIGFTDGPAISDDNGKMYRTRDIDDMLHEVLIEIFEDDRNLFPIDITNTELVRRHYQCYRTFRRSSDTRAIEEEVEGLDVDIVNRWAKVERAKGKRPGHKMPIHYAQFELLLKPFLRYTSAM